MRWGEGLRLNFKWSEGCTASRWLKSLLEGRGRREAKEWARAVDSERCELDGCQTPALLTKLTLLRRKIRRREIDRHMLILPTQPHQLSAPQRTEANPHKP